MSRNSFSLFAELLGLLGTDSQIGGAELALELLLEFLHLLAYVVAIGGKLLRHLGYELRVKLGHQRAIAIREKVFELSMAVL